MIGSTFRLALPADRTIARRVPQIGVDVCDISATGAKNSTRRDVFPWRRACCMRNLLLRFSASQAPACRECRRPSKAQAGIERKSALVLRPGCDTLPETFPPAVRRL
jgi:hypothetical protein